MGGFTYIMTNKPFGVLYIGVTSDIARIQAHREKRVPHSQGNGIAHAWS